MTVDGLERFPNARDIEKVARNPECRTLRTALAANVDLRKFAVQLGLEEDRQSPIAIARGEQVERAILGNDSARLLEKFVEDDRIDFDASAVDLGRRQKNREGMRKVADKTDAFVAALLRGEEAPDVLIHPVLRFPLGGDEQFIEPDALVRFRGAPTYEPLELKSYPYRKGRTDPEDLRQARRQGAVYVHALRLRVHELGGSEDIVRPQVTLVFTRPNSLYPAPVYDELVNGEIRDVQHALAVLTAARETLTDLDPDGTQLVDLLPDLDIHYTERCLSFCSLAKRCRERASAEAQACVLGERSSRVLGPITIPRMLELLDGAKPRDDAESSLAERFRSLNEQLGSFQEAI